MSSLLSLVPHAQQFIAFNASVAIRARYRAHRLVPYELLLESLPGRISRPRSWRGRGCMRAIIHVRISAVGPSSIVRVSNGRYFRVRSHVLAKVSTAHTHTHTHKPAIYVDKFRAIRERTDTSLFAGGAKRAIAISFRQRFRLDGSSLLLAQRDFSRVSDAFPS